MVQDAYSSIQDVEAWLRRVEFRVGEQVCSREDVELLIEAFTLQTALLTDLLPGDSCAMRSWKGWIKSIRSFDVKAFGLFQKTLSTAVRRIPEEFESHGPVSRADFKRRLSFPKWYGFLSPIWPVIDRLLQQPEANDLALVLQWVDFTVKVNLKSLDVVSEGIEEYCAFEEKLAFFPDYADLRPIISDWLSELDVSTASPHHGPKSTVEVSREDACRFVKDQLVFSDARLRFGRKFGLGVECPEGSLERCSELVFVPKSMITNRTISKEPTALQFYQQQLKEALYDYCRKHRFLSKVIDFSDQEKSSEMARLGSIFGDYATIDLSSASDSVTWSGVKSAFPFNLVALFCATRSDRTRLPDGTELTLRKFAPMGSAVCFPVETIVFSAICEKARREARSRRLFRVFGDDIVVPREYAQAVWDSLIAHGFTPNARKSFMDGTLNCFREACGGEFYQGIDVCPLRLSRWLQHCSGNTPSHDVVASHVGLANRLFDHGLWNTRSTMFRLFAQKYGRRWMDLQPRSEDGRFGLAAYPEYCTNFRLRSRWNTDYQVLEYQHWISVPRQPGNSDIRRLSRKYNLLRSEDDIRYEAWLEANQEDDSYYVLPSGCRLDARVRPDSLISVLPKRPSLKLRFRSL